MKQTVLILTALVLTLMVVTGFILTGSLRQTELMAQRDEMLMDLRQQHSDLTLENLRLTRELDQTRTERDALTAQLNDAILASQEANDAVAFQVSQRQSLETALDQANREIERLRTPPE